MLTSAGSRANTLWDIYEALRRQYFYPRRILLLRGILVSSYIMGFIKKRIRVLPLFAALLIVLAWPAHEAFAHHADDNDCQVCSVSCSPQLNADCGSVLLAAPERFELVIPVFSVSPGAAGLPPAFQGRAPPKA